MKVIQANKIRDTVLRLCIQANYLLRADVLRALRRAYAQETKGRVKRILGAIIENASVAKRERLAICQDTGLPVVFLEVGQGVKIVGDFMQAVQRGVGQGYRKAALRNSIVKDPLRRGTPRYAPAIIHTEIVKGDHVKIAVLPKGFGCENKTRLRMFNPTAGIAEIKQFVVETVKSAGPDACPPYIVGIGIGGTADYAAFLAKKALLKKVTTSGRHPARMRRTSFGRKAKGLTARLEEDLLKDINRLSIGPMGLGGRTTALAVNIEMYPTHIAGLPVAVNISCHALRGATAVL